MASTRKENYNPEEYLLNTLNDLDIGFVKVSNDGIILNHNLAFNKIFGFDPEINLIDTKVLDYWLNSEERNKFREILYKNGIVKKFVTSAKKIDGKKIVLELTFKLNKNSNGEIISSEGTFIDVTEHIENEQKLKDSEEKYHLISENANDMISILNEKFEIEYFNENTYQKLLGYSKDEVIGNLSLKYIHPDDIEHATRLFKEIFKSGEAQGDIRVKNKFGRYFWLEAKGKTFIDKNGKKKILMISRDITERKKAEEEIKSRYEFERLISLISIDFINILNENLNDLINLALKKIGQFINAVRCSIFIYSEDLTRVTNTNEWCIDPNDSQIALLQNIPSENFGYYLKLLKEKKNVIINRFDDIPLEASGEREWIQEYGFRSLMFVPMVYKDKLFGTLGFYGEINVEREWVKDLIDLLKILANIFVNSIVSKQSEELLYHERDLIRTLLDNHPDFIYFKDSNARYQHISKNFSDYFERGIEEIIGKTDLELFPREIANQPHSEDLNVIKTGIPLINKEDTDGETWVLSTKMPWPGKDGNIKGLFGISRDITERKKIELKLKESELKYKAAYNKAEFYKDIFTHDINNILSNIQTSIELSAMYLKDPNRIPDVEELYEVIREQFKKSSSLVSTIRKLSQIDEAVSLVKPVELNDVLKKEIDFILNSHQTRDVNIRTQGFEQIISVNANDLLIDLFQNLLNNAIKYNDSQIVEIYIKMSKEKKNKNDYIKLEFSDNGIGISDKRKDTLFEKDYSKEISSKGLGIGLTLVKKIVESYKGEIWIEDRITGDYRQGANFIVLIPEAV